MHPRRRRRPLLGQRSRKKHGFLWKSGRRSAVKWTRGFQRTGRGRQRTNCGSAAVVLLVFLLGFLAGAAVYLVTDRVLERAPLDRPPLRMGDERFAVDLGSEVKQESAGRYSLDAQLPRIISGFESADRINGEIASDFWYVTDLSAAAIAQAFHGWKEPVILIRYDAEEKGDLFVVTVTLKLESAHTGGKQTMTYIYQYDVKKQKRVIPNTPVPQITIE